jgi:hypothetical protein
MLSHDLRLNVWCNFSYATKAILIVNVANWHFSFRAKELLVVLVQALAPY